MGLPWLQALHLTSRAESAGTHGAVGYDTQQAAVPCSLLGAHHKSSAVSCCLFAVMQHYLDCGSLGSSERLIHGLPWRLWSSNGCYRPLDLLQATIRRPGRQRDSHQPRPCKRVRGCSRNVHCQSRCLQLGGRVTRPRCGRIVGLLQGAGR